MAETTLKDKTVNGVLWNSVNRFATQGIQFVFNILIARILLPEDYGLVAMLGIFMSVSQAFIDSGFTSALVRKNNRTETDYNTVFYFNLVISTFFCALLWFSAPAIASFYNSPELIKITRTICFTLIINAIGAVQHTHLTIEINFRSKALISIIRITIVGAVGLWMAKHGYGVWTLVAQSLIGCSISTILVCYIVRWHPQFLFSWQSFKEMFSFGSKLLASSLLDTVWGNIYTIVIGKVMSPASLGIYNRAESFATFPSSNIYGLVQGVSYPVLCSIQDDIVRLREAFRKFIKSFAYIVFPMMIGLAVVADPFIRLILTDKWADSIPYLEILCFSLMWYPINGMNMTVPNVLGRSDMYLKMVVITKVLDVVVLIITVPLGLRAMCLGRICTSLIGFCLCSQNARLLLNYNTIEQIKDFVPSLISSVIMGVIVFLIMHLFDTDALKLIIGVISGLGYYWVISVLLKKEEYRYLLDIIKHRFHK